MKKKDYLKDTTLLRSTLKEINPRKIPADFFNKRPALVVCDMQNYFYDEDSHAFVPSIKHIVVPLKKTVEIFLVNRLPVIFTRHIDSDDTSMSVWWRDRIADDRRAGLIADFDNYLDQSYTIQKDTYDSFFRTPLEEILNKNSSRSLFVCGVMTHLCCETTVRSAFVRGYDVALIADCTATYNFEFHRSSLLNISHGFGYLPLHKEVLECLKS